MWRTGNQTDWTHTQFIVQSYLKQKYGSVTLITIGNIDRVYRAVSAVYN